MIPPPFEMRYEGPTGEAQDGRERRDEEPLTIGPPNEERLKQQAFSREELRKYLEGEGGLSAAIAAELRSRQEQKATIEATPLTGGDPPYLKIDLNPTPGGFCVGGARDLKGNQVKEWAGGAEVRPAAADPGHPAEDQKGVYRGEIKGVPPQTEGGGSRPIEIGPLGRWPESVRVHIPPCLPDPRVYALKVQNGEARGPSVSFFTMPEGGQGITYDSWVFLDREPPDMNFERSWGSLANGLGYDYGVPSANGWQQWNVRTPVAVMETNRFRITSGYSLEGLPGLSGSDRVLEDLEAIMGNLNLPRLGGSDLKLGITITDIDRLTATIAGNPGGPIFTDPTSATPEVAQTAQNVLEGLANQGIVMEVERVEVLTNPNPTAIYGGGDNAAPTDRDYRTWTTYNPGPVQDARPIAGVQNMILDVPAMVPCGGRCTSPADAELKPIPGGGLDPSFSDSPLVLIESLGGSTGQVFRVSAIGGGIAPLPSGQGIVLEPVAVPERARRRLRESAEGSPAAVWNAYCLEFLRQVPTGGMVYRIAGPESQRAAEPFRSIAAAARRLNEAGALHPDSDPDSYFHSILQWAIWTQERGFGEASFAQAFLEHTQRSFRRSGAAWNPDLERTVRGYASGRWRDIQTVLGQAGQ